jgi:hypothetical protein
MARITDAEVRELVEVDDDTDIDWAVQAAEEMVDEHLLSVGISPAIQSRIALFLGAHFVALAYERGSLIRESTGQASASYANIFSEGLRATRWGQQALALDSSGTLANASNTKARAEFRLV